MSVKLANSLLSFVCKHATISKWGGKWTSSWATKASNRRVSTHISCNQNLNSSANQKCRNQCLKHLKQLTSSKHWQIHSYSKIKATLMKSFLLNISFCRFLLPNNYIKTNCYRYRNLLLSRNEEVAMIKFKTLNCTCISTSPCWINQRGNPLWFLLRLVPTVGALL